MEDIPDIFSCYTRLIHAWYQAEINIFLSHKSGGKLHSAEGITLGHDSDIQTTVGCSKKTLTLI